MPTRTWLLPLFLLVAFFTIDGHPRAAGPTATLHVVGDLPGGEAFSVVRDVTRVGNVLYASGVSASRYLCALASQPPGCLPTGDTGFLWRFDGTNTTMQALPDLSATLLNNAINAGWDLTPDGRYIASQARLFFAAAPPVTAHFEGRGVRVDTTVLPDAAANLNLAPGVFPNGTQIDATAISDDGRILYGLVNSGGVGRATRFDATTQTSTLIPLVVRGGVTDTANGVSPRGTSSSGDVVVGTSTNGTPALWAYRYKHGEGVTAIPRLPGGTFNRSIAVSPDGDLVLLSGNNPSHGNAIEVYFWRASTNQIQQLGSPNSSTWNPGYLLCNDHQCNVGRALVGGMTADGSVVAINFGGLDAQFAYFRNQHGWFHLASALAANGIDLSSDGWNPTTVVINGISRDGTLVYGAGAQNGVVKGFIVEFAAGALAAFNPTPTPPANKSIVGAWSFGDPNNPDGVILFNDDGTYYDIERAQSPNEQTGRERGYYTFDGSHLGFTALLDSNGGNGPSGISGSSLAATLVGNVLTGTSPWIDPQLVAQRVVGAPGEIIGGWIGSDDTDTVALVLTPNRYFFGADHPDGSEAELGSYFWNVVSHALVATPDSGAPNDNTVTLTADERGLIVVEDNGETNVFSRVIHPLTPAITSALSATATSGLSFAYQITATQSPSTFGAVGLPAGLNIDAAGLIAGTPTATGSFDVLIKASNAVSTSTGVNHLLLTVVAPAVVNTGATTVTPIPPDAPGEPAPLTIEFSNVTTGGTISVATIDPETVLSAPDPPAGFSLGDPPIYYEITPSESLTFTGPVTVCFSYAGITFTGFPRLLHYDETLAQWIDITTSVDTATSTICGLTSSFSPFALAAAALRTVGFHAPTSPLAGALNIANAGSTVPLKFNVFGESGEITNPAALANLVFEASPVVCEGGAPENWTGAATTGSTGLRYDSTAHQFVQNWKTPKTPGCYFVRLQADGVLLSALFRLK